MRSELKIGDVIRKAREETGLAQEKLAEKAGLHRVAISMLERDVRSPSLDTVFKLAGALGLSPAEFVDRVDKANRRKVKS